MRAAAPALEVVSVLQQAGHPAYLVGGCVRDLLLECSPKDFDVATAAKPEKILRLFKHQARKIGRRFPIVTVTQRGKPTIEVTTFRGDITDAVKTSSGLIRRDTAYGSIEQDALRRDLTVNALYLDVKNACVLDYTGGLQDIEHKRIRIIGNPETRFREDPARMLRCIRFAARLGLDIDVNTHEALLSSAPLLSSVVAARMYDEFAKTLCQRGSWQSWQLLNRYDMLKYALPALHTLLKAQPEPGLRLIKNLLRHTEERLQRGERLNQTFFYAALLWPIVLKQKPFSPPFKKRNGQLSQYGPELLARIHNHIRMPRTHQDQILAAWTLQARMEFREDPKNTRVAHGFSSAFELLKLRRDTENNKILDSALVSFWEEHNTQGRSERLARTRKPSSRRRPRRHGRRPN